MVRQSNPFSLLTPIIFLLLLLTAIGFLLGGSVQIKSTNYAAFLSRKAAKSGAKLSPQSRTKR
jgi:hypothetical protein